LTREGFQWIRNGIQNDSNRGKDATHDHEIQEYWFAKLHDGSLAEGKYNHQCSQLERNRERSQSDDGSNSPGRETVSFWWNGYWDPEAIEE